MPVGLSAFATVEELSVRLPGGLDAGDENRAQAALEDASTLIRAEAGMEWQSDVPGIVVAVTLWSAIRAMTNPEGVTQETLVSYSYSVAPNPAANPSTDVYLTARERRLVRRAAGRSGLSVQPTSRGLILETSRDPYWTGDGGEPAGTGISDEKTGTQYVAVEGGEPIPWVGPDGF